MFKPIINIYHKVKHSKFSRNYIAIQFGLKHTNSGLSVSQALAIY